MEEQYRHSQKESIQRVKPKIWDPRWYYLNILRDDILACVISEVSHKGILLDFGCGAMPYRASLSPYLSTYLGADLEDNPMATVLVDSDGKLKQPDNSVDYILSTQVLEHVADVHLYLTECYRVLKPGGKIILSTHGYWMFHPDPTDFWRWTSSGLKRVIEQNKFKVKKFSGVIGRAAMGLQLFQDGIMFKLPSVIRPLLVIPLQLGIALFDKLEKQKNKADDACTFIVVAQK